MDQAVAADYEYCTYKNLSLHAAVYRAQQNRKNQAILYLHGGGLLYGSKNDLPSIYINLLLESGYDLIALDYPLAPEAPLSDILDCLQKGIEWFKHNASSTLQLATTDYFLFGRSAGAFLCLVLTAKYQAEPLGIISFYGYHSLKEPALSLPNPYYTSFSAVPKKMADRLLYPAPVAAAALETRYMLYVYYRQQGTWLNAFLSSPYEKTKFSLHDEDLQKLPPVFLTASRNDTDIPFSVSQYLSTHIPHAAIEPVDGNVHDFDRDVSTDIGLEVYNKAIDWLSRAAT